ncbi:MAG TPA: DUF4412 domain-containing protein [Vicinamibacterales bacterium]|nr:DUF4412 domain-containing protein [Vicinamibacterales bacterium]
MMRFTSRALLFVAVCAAASPAGAAQGVLVVETSTVNGAPRTTQVQIEPTRMRTEIAGQNGTSQVVIFDGGKQILYMIDPAAKTYSEMTKAEVDAAGAQMGDMMAQMQKTLEGLPPAQRAQMEAMMKGRMGGMPGAPGAAAKTEYRRSGTSKVGKWTCEAYEAFQNNVKTGEVCTVSPSALGFNPNDFEVSRQLAAFIRGLIPQGADQVFQTGRVQEQGYEGVPVRRVSTIAGTQIVTELTSVARQTFPDSAFAIPEGFTKTTSPLGRMGRGRGRQ